MALSSNEIQVSVPDPIGNSLPQVSNLNFSTGETVANAVLAPMTNGKQDFFDGGPQPTQLIADFFGYFATPLATTAPPASASAPSLSANAKAGPTQKLQPRLGALRY